MWITHLEREQFDEELEQMERFVLKSKIHRATLTGTDLNYEGSITIDQNLLEKADILPGEQVHVLNINNGQRFVTYAIAAPRGSGTVLLNGPAARLGMVGDKVIIISYCQVPDGKAKGLRAKVVFVDDENKPKEGDNKDV
jgi:aspartate 1-decarboxylase